MQSNSRDASKWPAEMTIRVSSNPDRLLELLWVRHQAGLIALPELPMASLPHVEAVNVSPILAAMWEDSWHSELAYLLSIQEIDPYRLATRRELWIAPKTVDIASALGVSTSNLEAWAESLESAEHAEYAVVAQLHAAWKRGLRVVVELPLRGFYSSRPSLGSIVVSAETRNDPREYAAALAVS